MRIVVLSVATVFNFKIRQMDEKIAFSNEDLNEEIYMEQLKSFIVPGQEKKVYKLIKSLYDLKKTPKKWHEKFDCGMMASRFKINECDKCVYIKDAENGYVMLCLYIGLTEIISGIKICRTSDELVLKSITLY